MDVLRWGTRTSLCMVSEGLDGLVGTPIYDAATWSVPRSVVALVCIFFCAFRVEGETDMLSFCM